MSSLRLREKIVTQSKSILPQEGISSFIRKTYELLEEKSHSDIVSWSEDGNFLVIKDLDRFTQQILPSYFRHNKMNSFVRQLNMYNFRKKRTMNSYHVYYNEFFKRGRTDLLGLIKRKTSSEYSNSPNNYVMAGDDYNLSSVPTSKVNDYSAENLMLKKMNQKAFAKIGTLETRINELLKENDHLVKQISEKQKKEDFLHNALSQCFTNEKPNPFTTNTTTNSVGGNHAFAKSGDNSNSHHLHTPETASQSQTEEVPNIDSFLNLDNQENETKGRNKPRGYNEPSYSSLGKRNFYSNDMDRYDFNSYNPSKNQSETEAICRNEPCKMTCTGNPENEDKAFSMLRADFSLFSNGLIEDTF